MILWEPKSLFTKEHQDSMANGSMDLKNACCKSSEDLKEIAHIPHLLSGHRISLHRLFPYCPKVQFEKSQMFSISLFI